MNGESTSGGTAQSSTNGIGVLLPSTEESNPTLRERNDHAKRISSLLVSNED